MRYSDYDGHNFAECVSEVIGMWGEEVVCNKIVEVIDDYEDDSYEFDLAQIRMEILNALWCM